ncbi:MAG: hypothetical protein K0T99_02820 [Alphaproteobacteria bacterium]|nr:hypothetical protein [Alphaproteobacteria bacterium]
MGNKDEACYDHPTPGVQYSEPVKERCYETYIAPDNINQNCAMWEYDHSEGVYITSMTVRRITYVATPFILMYLTFQLTTSAFATVLFGQGPVASVASLGITLSVPLISFKTKFILELNDYIFYEIFGRDEILEDTKLLNRLISNFDFFSSYSGTEAGDLEHNGDLL